MKRSTLALLCIASLLAHTNTYSQSDNLRYLDRGITQNRDIMTPAEMGQFSQKSFQYGTARSMAMAGAMSSLGADASSMMLNPAGLGMYQHNEFSFTPVVMIQDGENKGGSKYYRDRDSGLKISNLSFVINLYESGKTPLISLNLGLGYNKIANLDYSSSLISYDQKSSIADQFSDQLTSAGVSLNELYGNDYPNWNNLESNLWGAALGYKAGLTFQTQGVIPEDYDSPSEPITESDRPVWGATWIGNNASIDHYLSLESEGSIGEYDIALGGNIQNKLYLGFTLGIQSVYQRLDILYSEEYDNSEPLQNELLFTNYNQTILTGGAGVNIKLGATYRPTEELRLAVAYHSPTWYSLHREYQGSIASASYTASSPDQQTYISADSPILEDFGENKWRFNTPSRVILGGSYIFASRAIVSVDYQRDWYNNMKYRKLPYSVPASLYDDFSSMYQAVNTLRVGAELKVSPLLALRGGYGFSSSMIADGVTDADLLDIPTTDKINYFSAGIGYSPSRKVRFDFTYMNQKTTMTPYTLFYGDGSSNSQSKTFRSDYKQHNIALAMIIKM